MSSDPLAQPVTGGGIPGVTRDATNLQYYPANAAEWTALMAAAGLGTGNPIATWNAQESSGSLADSIGTVTLTPAGWTLYAQAITGATRLGARGVDGATNVSLNNTTTAPNPATTSLLMLAYLDFPATPAGNRGIMATASTGSVIRWLLTTGKLRIVAGANTDTVNSVASTQGWVALRTNITASSITLFTQAEKLLGTFAAPTAGSFTIWGGMGGAAGPAAAVGYAYGALFSSTGAEMTDAQVKTLLQTLGATIPWT